MFDLQISLIREVYQDLCAVWVKNNSTSKLTEKR